MPCSSCCLYNAAPLLSSPSIKARNEELDDTPEDIAAALRLLWSGQGGETERALASDALWVARDLGTYGCGALGPGPDEDYRFWRARAADTSAVPPTERLQPDFRYGLDR